MTAAATFENQVAEHRQYLLRFARLQLRKVLEVCTEKLPPAMARVFMMRLHRARLRLRECLELSWFSRRPAE